MGKRRQAWTNERVEQARALAAAGHNAGEVASILGTSRGRIAAVAKENGILFCTKPIDPLAPPVFSYDASMKKTRERWTALLPTLKSRLRADMMRDQA